MGKIELASKAVEGGEGKKSIVPTLPLNEKEKNLIAEWKHKKDQSPSGLFTIKATLDENGKPVCDPEMTAKERSAERLRAAFSYATGSIDDNFGADIVGRCLSASGVKVTDSEGGVATGILNTLQALKPQDEIEGMLITRLISLHYQSMRYLSRCNNEDQTTQGIDVNVNRSTKLSRLYNETLETLMRYRRKGMQQLVVQHVQVNDGGKAVVSGNMVAGK
jgi:hypothetical protein